MKWGFSSAMEQLWPDALLTLPMTHITAGIETQVHAVKVQQLNQ